MMFMIDLAASSHYSILGLQPDADRDEISRSHNLKDAEMRRKIANSRDPTERESLERQLIRLTQIGAQLRHPVNRQIYDKEHLHLTFFVVRQAAAPALAEPGMRLEWVHRAVRDFLEDQGESVEPVTDLERTDFMADFTENALLERLLSSPRPGGTS